MNHYIGKGKTGPSYLTKLLTGKALTGGTVRFRMRKQGVHGAALKVDKNITIVDGTVDNNLVRVDFLNTETDEKGVFDAQFIITYSDGQTEAVPADGPSLAICVGEAL
jgi:hypothetical protein